MSVSLDLVEPPVIDPVEEFERVASLRSVDLLDTPAEDRFDRITRLAAEFFQVPIAYVAFIDSDRQWFKSRYGLCPTETSRHVSFCQHTIHRGEPIVIPDAKEHPIGRDHPMVTGDPFVRFYAGIPLSGPRGRKIGTFCIVDLQPREFDEEQLAKLVAFASLVEREVNLGEIIQTQSELLNTREELVKTQAKLNQEFADAAKYVALMLPPPLTGRDVLDWQFHPSTHLGGDGLGYRRIDEDRLAIYVLDVTGHGLGSALLAVTALEFLRSPMKRDFDFGRPHEVIDRLNRTFQMEDHAGKFFSVWYGVYSHAARTLTYANAGHPPALIVDRNGATPRVIQTESGGSVLGISPDLHIKESTVSFGPKSELCLFTDGLYELTDPDGRGSYDEFKAALLPKIEQAGKSGWDAMLEWLDSARQNRSIDDDVTLLRFAAPQTDAVSV